MSDTSISPGDSFSVHLRNSTTSRKEMGDRKHFDAQRSTDGGWQSIYCVKEDEFWRDEIVNHRPSEGFAWNFTFTRSGLVPTTGIPPEYRVCDQLPSGSYRFVYWGFIEDVGSELAVVVPFEVTGSA